MDVLAQLSSSLRERYALDREIGRGGMATVYLARDVRHNRKVALKVLNPELGAVLGVERFLSEIQVTANLQHPNLLPLFDSGEAEGLLFYVMPYVEGESLRAKLQREKQLPVDEAIHMATSVLSALDYAHRHGVIHRDLKPENILVHDNQPLIADFGIALAVSNAGGNRITQTGLSLGTPQYMSPEQATGDREIDGRTDVYSMGAVLYEMLAGEPPHDGKTSQAIIAKVLTDKPRSIRLMRDTVPRSVEAAVERALAKLPADRFHSAHEFADALTGKVATGLVASGAYASARGEPHAHAQTGWRTRTVASIPWIVTAAAIVAAGLGWREAFRLPAPRAERYEVPLPNNTTLPVGLGNPIASGPGGRFAFVAYDSSGKQKLYLRTAEELEPREVSGSEGASFPVFSPEGDWLAFWAGGQLKKVSVTGGTPVPIAEGIPRAVTWSKSGWMVMTRQDGNRAPLGKLPAAGGELASFTQLDSARGETGQLGPVALGDGKTILYQSFARGGTIAARIGVASIVTGKSKVLDIQGAAALGYVDGYLVYATAAGSVNAIRFDAATWTTSGPTLPLGDRAVIDGANSTGYASLSSDGSLAYMNAPSRRQMVLTTGDGNARPIGEVGVYAWPRLSPDGKRIAVTVGSLSERHVWIYQLPSGPFSPLTNGSGIHDRPEWTSDGRAVMYRRIRGDTNEIWSTAIDGGSPPKRVFGIPPSKIDEGVLSNDGRLLAFQRDRNGNGEAWIRAMQGDTTPREVEVSLSGYSARFSPDGKWVVYTSGGGANAEVFARPVSNLSTRFQVSLNGGNTPIWSADGKRIYYMVSSQVMAATVGSTQPFTITSRVPVLTRGYTFDQVHADYDVASDSRTILALKTPNESAQLVVVRNLGSVIRARLAGTPR